MTNKEAREWLEAIKEKYIHGGDEGYDKKRKEALDIGIKALAQEPCDAVSRDAVLNTLENMDKALDIQRPVESYKELLVECMKELPSVHPECIEDYCPVVFQQMHEEYITKMDEVRRAYDNISRAKPCDAVSREAVLDINENHHGQMPNHINHQIWQEIKDLPSVQPECTEDYCPEAFKPVECEDCVSREAMRKEIVNAPKWFVERDGKKCIGLLYDDVARILYGAPTIQPKQRTGRWIANGETFRCSECGELACCQGRYCNECGAMMEVEG